MVLHANLQQWGYDVATVTDGDAAWEFIKASCPDIVILDWEMPGKKGIELCKMIRQDESLPYLYVILVTSYAQDAEIVEGLASGADDYIVKPCSKSVLRSRIEVGVRSLKYERTLADNNVQLQRYASEMEGLAQERSKQLIHAERIATAGILSAGIAHEINNPMTFISGNIQMLERLWDDMKPLLESVCDSSPESSSKIPACAGSDSARGETERLSASPVLSEITNSYTDKMSFILEQFPEIISDMRSGVSRISKIVKGLKAFCRKDHGAPTPCNMNDCIEQALVLCNNALKYHVKVVKELDDQLSEIIADAQQIEQVLVNLFINAADAMAGKEAGFLHIGTRNVADGIEVTVDDTGPGIPLESVDDIWQPFYTTKPVDKGTGLGLSISMGIIEKHAGKIAVDNKTTGGAVFTITLPIIGKGISSESQNIDSG